MKKIKNYKTKIVTMQDSRNEKALQSFIKYCESHPYERFWQALRNWSEYNYIFGSDDKPENLMKDYHYSLEDTFYREGR